MNNDKIINFSKDAKDHYYSTGNGTLVGLIIFLCLTYTYLVPKININWDEFLYLSNIYNYESGRHIPSLQTIYIHLFGWLKGIPGNEISQIIVARYVYLALLFICLAIIYAVSAKIFSHTNALFTIFLILSFSDIIRHGFSFRADLLCALLFLISILFVFKKNVFIVLISSLSMALCFLVSIKSVFYLPTLLLLLFAKIHHDKNKGETIRTVVVYFSLVIIFFIGLYWLHSILIAQNLSQFQGKIAESQNKIIEAGNKVLWTGRFFPREYNIKRSISENAGTWFVIFASIFFGLKNFFKKGNKDIRYVALFFALPLLSLIIYRNAFPYFFVFLLPVSLIVTNIYINELSSYMRQERKVFAVILFLVPIIFASISATKTISLLRSDKTIAQREILDTVHKMYPQPVPYIDRNRMVSSFPNVGFWMSTWGMESYRMRGIPVMKSILGNQQPQLLIANSPVLQIYDARWFGQQKSIYRLFDEDYMILKQNFIHHWGIIYVPGKYFQFDETDQKTKFTIIIEGQYTIESQGASEIDGREMTSGDVLFLTKGAHTIRGNRNTNGILRWGDHLYKPEKNPAKAPIYTGL